MNLNGGLGAYETITVHFIKNWKLMSCVLHTDVLLMSHTGENLASNLNQVMEKWNVGQKTSAVTTDNVSNMVGACEQVANIDINIGCFAHTINLATQKGSKTIIDASNL